MLVPFGWLAAIGLLEQVGYQDVLKVAARLEAGAKLGYPLLKRVSDLSGQGPFASTCNQRISRSKVTIVLSALKAARETGSQQDITAATDTAHKVLAAARRCAPMDGNLWFRTAVLEFQQSGLSPSVVENFRKADQLAPHEGWIIRSRLPSYAYLSAQAPDVFESAASRDMRLWALSGADPQFAAMMLERWPDLQDSFLKGIAGLPPTKGEKYREAVRTRMVSHADTVLPQQHKMPEIDLDPFRD